MILESETSFGLNFLQTLPQNESVIFSPLSISFLLSMVYSGANGTSKEQIENAILQGSNDIVSHFSDILKSLKNSEEGVDIRVANRIYIKEKFTVKFDYLASIINNFDAGVESVDFSLQSTARDINHFVHESTNGKIDDIVDTESLENLDTLLLNVLYFKGNWSQKFNDRQTANHIFVNQIGSVRRIPFLISNDNYRLYSSDDVFRVLVLPYEDPEYKFAIFLPKKRFDFENSVKKLNASRFQSLLDSVEQTWANIEIPKFTLENEFSLVESLKKLGILDIFNERNSDLSGIAEGLFVSDGVHKALIEIDEGGTTAAAVSGLELAHVGLPPLPIDFVANRPFIFSVIRDSHPLFLGTFHGDN